MGVILESLLSFALIGDNSITMQKNHLCKLLIGKDAAAYNAHHAVALGQLDERVSDSSQLSFLFVKDRFCSCTSRIAHDSCPSPTKEGILRYNNGSNDANSHSQRKSQTTRRHAQDRGRFALVPDMIVGNAQRTLRVRRGTRFHIIVLGVALAFRRDDS